MFWTGLFFGLFIGANVGIVMAALLMSSKGRPKTHSTTADKQQGRNYYPERQTANTGSYQPTYGSHLVRGTG
jgi:hypothetical protein